MWFMLAMGGITLTIILAVEILIDSHKDRAKSEKLKWSQWLGDVFKSKLFFLILLAVIQMVVGIYFTNKNQIKLNSTVNDSTKFEIQANIKSNNDNIVPAENKSIKPSVFKNWMWRALKSARKNTLSGETADGHGRAGGQKFPPLKPLPFCPPD